MVSILSTIIGLALLHILSELKTEYKIWHSAYGAICKRVNYILSYKKNKLKKQEMKNLMQKVSSILSEDGFRPSIDNKENQISVMVDGNYIYIEFLKDDPNFMRMSNFIKDFTIEERSKMLDIANKINCNIKYAFIVVYETQLIIHCDIYLNENVDIRDILTRYIQSLFAAEKKFFESISLHQYGLN